MVPRAPPVVDESLEMTTELAGKVCTPCQGGVAPLGPEEAARYLAEVPGWTLADEGSAISVRTASGIFARRLPSPIASAHWPRARAIIPTSALVGATRRSRCKRRRSKACTKTISSWPRRSIAQRQPDRRTRAQGRRLRSARCPGLSPEELTQASTRPERL